MSILLDAARTLKPPCDDEALGTPIGRARWLMQYLEYQPHVAEVVLAPWRESRSLNGLDALDIGDRPHVEALLLTAPVEEPAPVRIRRGRQR